MEYFNYVGSVTKTDARCAREIKSGIVIQQQEGSFHQQIGYNRRKKSKVLFLEPSFVWTILKVDQKYLQSFEMR